MAIAKKVVAKKSAAKKAVVKAAGPKPIRETLGKTGLIEHIAASSGVEAKEVRKVLAAFEQTIASSMSKKGAGTFVLPGYLKITAVKVPAKPKRKGMNRFTGQEQWFAAKPASSKLRIRALKKLRDAIA